MNREKCQGTKIIILKFKNKGRKRKMIRIRVIAFFTMRKRIHCKQPHSMTVYMEDKCTKFNKIRAATVD